VRPLVLAAVVLVVAGVLLATHPAQTRAVLSQLRRLPAWALAGAFGLILTQLACQGMRLWAVVPRNLSLGPGRVVSDWAAGEWVNMFAPARAGDALKVLLIRRRPGGDPSGVPAATGAVLADKVVDLASIVLLCAAGGLIGLLWTRAAAGLFWLSLVGAAVLVVLVALRLKGATWWHHSRRWVRELIAGFSALRDPPRLLVSLGFSLTAWVAEGGALWALCAGLGMTLAASQVLLALVVLNVGISVPIALANLGVYEAALAAGLHHAGVPLPTALAVAASHHGLELLALNVAAAGLSFKTLTARPA